MFGVLRGNTCTMKSEDREQWIGHICSVCLSLRDNYGQASRMATNYDAGLMSVLYEAQCPKPQTKYVSHCPLRRSFKAEVNSPSSPGARFAASMSLVMASTKIEDHVEDGETFLRHIPGISTKIAQKWKQAAQRTAKALGFDVNIIETQTRQQRRVEAQPNQDFFFYARPTELSVGAVLGHTAVIANRPQNADILFDIGRMFGRVVYLLDSYQDYVADLSLNKFNALAACFAKEETQWQTARIFHQAFHEIKHLFNRLDLPQPALAQGLLTRQLKRTGYKTLKINECTACSRYLPNGSTLVALNQGTALTERDAEEERRDTGRDVWNACNDVWNACNECCESDFCNYLQFCGECFECCSDCLGCCVGRLLIAS